MAVPFQQEGNNTKFKNWSGNGKLRAVILHDANLKINLLVDFMSRDL